MFKPRIGSRRIFIGAERIKADSLFSPCLTAQRNGHRSGWNVQSRPAGVRCLELWRAGKGGLKRQRSKIKATSQKAKVPAPKFRIRTLSCGFCFAFCLPDFLSSKSFSMLRHPELDSNCLESDVRNAVGTLS